MTRREELHGVIIGLGSIGNRHLKNFQQLGVGKLTVVRRSKTRNLHFETPDGAKVSHDLASTLAEQPDFAVVCNPSHLHVATTRQCLEADCAVLVEKPLSATPDDDSRELQALADNSSAVTAMAYCMRYHPAYRLAREHVEANTIGKILYAKAWFEGYLPDWHPWEDYRTSYAARVDQAGGVLRTLDHELDFLNWALGPAKSALGNATNTGSLGIEADDLAMYQLDHPDGIRSQVVTAFCRKPASRGFEFVGETGTLSFRMEVGKLLQATHDSPNECSVLAETTNYDINQMYVDLGNDFLDAICDKDHDRSILATITDGLNCTTLFSQIDTTG